MDVPSVDLADLYSGIRDQKVSVGYPGVSLRLLEQVNIAQLVRYLRPQAVFEIGTGFGGTTLLMAENADKNTRIFTLDLSPDLILGAAGETVGIVLRENKLESRSRITQLWGDSRDFDYDPWIEKIDLVFVDACHEYAYVKTDTDNALKLLSSRGVIVWHDYPSAPGVCRAVKEFAQQRKVYMIEGTRIAVYDSRMV